MFEDRSTADSLSFDFRMIGAGGGGEGAAGENVESRRGSGAYCLCIRASKGSTGWVCGVAEGFKDEESSLAGA